MPDNFIPTTTVTISRSLNTHQKTTFGPFVEPMAVAMHLDDLRTRLIDDVFSGEPAWRSRPIGKAIDEYIQELSDGVLPELDPDAYE
jgi:hypothetical protein